MGIYTYALAGEEGLELHAPPPHVEGGLRAAKVPDVGKGQEEERRNKPRVGATFLISTGPPPHVRTPFGVRRTLSRRTKRNRLDLPSGLSGSLHALVVVLADGARDGLADDLEERKTRHRVAHLSTVAQSTFALDLVDPCKHGDEG